MTDPTDEFFERLSGKGREPLVQRVTGTVRFEISEGDRTDRWLVGFDDGDISVSRGNGPADCSMRGDRALFNRIVTGESNPMAALLRGAVALDGDPELLVLIQRLFPAKPSTREDTDD